MSWFRMIVAISLCLMLSAGAVSSAPDDDTAALRILRSEVIGLLRKERPATKPKAGSDPWLVELRTGTLSILNLARSVEGLEGAARREEILRFVDRALPAGLSKSIASFASIEKRLRVQIAPAEYAANSQLRALGRRFSDDLIVAYVVDYPDHIEYVREDHMNEWKVDRETIEKTAIANLDRTLTRSPIEIEEVKSGLGRHMILVDNDGYGAARVLCPGFMARVREKLGSRLFIGIPTRDSLIMWMPGHASRKKLVELVDELFRTRSHPLTRTVFVTGAGGLRPAQPAELGD